MKSFDLIDVKSFILFCFQWVWLSGVPRTPANIEDGELCNNSQWLSAFSQCCETLRLRYLWSPCHAFVFVPFFPKVLQFFVPCSYLKEITANNTLSRFPNFVFILLFRRLTYSLVTECFFMASFNKRR